MRLTASLMTPILDAIDRKYLAASQALLITDGQHRREDMGDVGARRAHRSRDRGEVRRAGAAQRVERDMLLAQPGDRPDAHHPTRVGAENHVEQDGRRIRGRAGRIVPEAHIIADRSIACSSR